MATIVTRAGKGSALTHTEMDANFTNLNTDKAETTATTNELNTLDMSASGSTSGQVLTSTGTGTVPTWQDSSGGVDGIVSTANATAITIDANENVGIGVTPESWDTYTALQIGGMGSLFGYTASAGSDFSLANNMYYNSGYKYIVTDEASQYQQVNGKHVFFVAPSGTADSAISWTNAMTIDNSGHLIIAKTSTNSAVAGVRFAGDAPGYSEHTRSGGNVMYINRLASTGTIIQFAQADNSVGDIAVTGSTTSYNTSSDYRLKENVVPMSASIDRLKQLKPCKFNFITDADKTVDGFLAHEAQEVVPEAVTGEKDAMRTEEYEVTPAVMDGETVVTEAVMGEREVPDYQGIDQSKLVPLLVASLQEAVEKIEALEARVTALEV